MNLSETPKTTKKLSELIAIGSKRWNQVFNDWGNDFSACALESALRIIEPKDYQGYRNSRTISILVGIDPKLTLSCPICHNEYEIYSLVMHLNDKERWLSARITDFLAKNGY